ncbi:glycoside hydrolase family 16 protein [Hypoxylon crocopeplum]|nr:glycoside hydrolase family 16 protein [Hypoxylon crocopeplum]
MTTGYSLTTHYAGQGLLDSFSFFTGNDPSNGFVDYQSKEDALAMNLVSIDSEYSSVRLGVDSNNTYSTSDKGRPSVRLTSFEGFTHGLFIADVYHMPSSTCGTWPAFWAFNNEDNGAHWPTGGELDIIEGANTAQRNLFSAHTTEGCQAPSTGFSGVQGPTDCSPSADNIGCNYASPTSDTTSYGDGFNAEGGGIYALEWDSQDLKLWHFPRSTIPDNIVYAHVLGPDPSGWGPPQAIFGGSSCDADTHFFNLSLVLNINFCGDYAGNIWGRSDQCNQLAPTCEEYVAGSPSSFQETYWDINFIDVYQFGPLTNTTVPPISSNATSSSTLSSISNSTEASSSVAPIHTRTITLSNILPRETVGGSIGPKTINRHHRLGCYGSGTSNQTFSRVTTSPDMDNEACVTSCAGLKYAALQNTTCYCADTLGDASAVDNGMCDTPCPGNSGQVCGGTVNADNTTRPFDSVLNTTLPANVTVAALHYRRATLTPILLTVYGDLSDEPTPPGAPAMGGNTDDEYPAPMHNETVTAALTVTYTTVCPTNPASLVEVEYCTTVTYGNCAHTQHKEHKMPYHTYPGHANLPTTTTKNPTLHAVTDVPMTTCVEMCHACGPHGENTITLTVPKAVYTEKAVVTSIAVKTVVPVIGNATATTAAYGTAAYTPSHSPLPSGSNVMPVIAAAPARSRTASIMQMLGWGLALWFGLFGAMLAL